MKFEDAKSAALEEWFRPDFSEAIIYNGANIQGHITYGGPNSLIADQAVLTVRVSDVPAPAYRDTVVIGGQAWRVYQDEKQGVIIKGDSMTWDLMLIRGERKAI